MLSCRSQLWRALSQRVHKRIVPGRPASPAEKSPRMSVGFLRISSFAEGPAAVVARGRSVAAEEGKGPWLRQADAVGGVNCSTAHHGWHEDGVTQKQQKMAPDSEKTWFLRPPGNERGLPFVPGGSPSPGFAPLQFEGHKWDKGISRERRGRAKRCWRGVGVSLGLPGPKRGQKKGEKGLKGANNGLKRVRSASA